MKDAPIVVVVSVVVLILGIGAYIAAPALWSAESVVNAEALRSVATARRCLEQYDANQEALQALNENLERGGVDLSLSSEQIQTYAEGHAEETFADVEERVNNRTKDMSRSKSELENRFHALGGTSDQASTAAATFSRSPSAMSSAMNKGRQTRETLLKANTALMTEAMTAIQDGMQFSKGDASGSSNLPLNSLKGAVLQHQGEMAASEARNLRIAADGLRQALMTLADQIEVSNSEADMAHSSKIDDLIKALQDQKSKLEQQLAKQNGVISDMDATVADLSGKLEKAKEARRIARAKMDALTQAGADLSKPNGAEEFATEYTAVSEEWRKADKLAHALENGTLHGASIGPDEDYLNGPYVPTDDEIDYKRGLVAWQADLNRAKEEARLIQDSLETTERNLGIQNNIRDGLLARENKARQNATELTSKFNEVFDQLVAARSEVNKKESEAIKKFAESSNAYGTASRAANTWRQPGPDFNMLSPEKQQQDPANLRQGDNWIEGDMDFQKAGVQVQESMAWYSRYRDAESDLAFYTKLGDTITLPSDVKQTLETERDEAKEKGTKAAKDASDAVKRISSKCSRHWTVAALAGDARYMLYLFGNEEALENAIGNYTNAIENREDSPATKIYRKRLEEMRKSL